MPASKYVRPTVWVPPAVSAVLQPQPPLAPSIPPVHAVDLMTEAGSAAFRSLRGACAPRASAPGSYRVEVPPLGYVVCEGAAQ